tara:strand:- start:2223 stop:3158 length:936 start_codon:yes stop_codon:yes gene_type:complete
MEYPKYFEPKKSLSLYGLEKDFIFISSLYSLKKLPKVLMLSSPRGSGKSTLINHFLFSVFDEKNYDNKRFILSDSSSFYNQFINNIFQNIVYLKGSDFKSIKVEDIRNLKSQIQQSTIINKDRFIILDDVELFNSNSLNALLKIIEEPSSSNYFILINNQTKPLLDTIKSRSIEVKIILNENKRLEIINKLLTSNNIETLLSPDLSKLTPGRFLKFNYICQEFDISQNNDFLHNLSTLLNLYKKDKDFIFIDLAFYLTDLYFKELKDKDIIGNDKIYDIKAFLLNNLNKFLTFNLSQKSLLNAISDKLKHG